jgi:hypothetical protein
LTAKSRIPRSKANRFLTEFHLYSRSPYNDDDDGDDLDTAKAVDVIKNELDEPRDNDCASSRARNPRSAAWFLIR